MGERRMMRSRWAAIGAAVAVSLGGGGVFLANAASSAPSAMITIDPVRILDTRTDVGLAGPFVSAVSQKLRVTGTTVPVGATGVLMNVTVVSPSATGFLSVRPGDASGKPTTSSLNFAANGILANSVQVALPTTGPNAGQIDITYDAYGVAGPTTEVLVDVVGYLVEGAAGPAGPAGPTGPTGATGPAGPVNVRWAKVGSSANPPAPSPFLMSGAGAVSVARDSVGVTSVTFDRSIVGCGWMATINENDRGEPEPWDITVERGDSSNDLRVKTWNSAGVLEDQDGAGTDGFTVTAICP